jgi:YD repeat-containing protein
VLDPDPQEERVSSTTKPPTPAQLRYLRQFAHRTGQTFVAPATRREASAQITRLKRVEQGRSVEQRRLERSEAAIERRAISAALARSGDAARIETARDVRGYGAHATWR